MQRQLAAKDLFQIALITRRQRVRLAAVNHYNGGILAAGMRIAELDPSSVHHRWWMARHRVLEDPGEARRAQGSGRGVMGRMNRTI